MAIENQPIMYRNSLVGRISLTSQIEEYLSEGFQFIISADILRGEDDGNYSVVGITLLPPLATETVIEKRE